MEVKEIPIQEENKLMSIVNEDLALYPDDTYGCTTCSYPVEILKIDDSENMIIFKCLNPKELET